MKELFTRAQADLVLTAGPIVLGFAALAWWRLRRSPEGLAAGVAVLLIGILWRVFNAISERIGIETVANLLVNGALFVVVGAGYGLWLRRILPAPPASSGSAPSSEPSPADNGSGSAPGTVAEPDRSAP